MLITEIRIKKNGKWYANDAEMFRKPILNLFANNLLRDDLGQYKIHLNQKTFPVVVEDVPFFAMYARLHDDKIIFVLHDEQELVIDKTVPLLLKDSVPYVSMRWEFDTRLSRSAFWMINEYLVEDGNVLLLVPPIKTKG